MKPLRVLSVSASDSRGGAARAARRVHDAFLERPGDVRSEMLVAHRTRSERGIHLVERNRVSRAMFDVVRRVLDQEAVLARTGNAVFHSPARLRTSALQRIHELDPDILLLHWLGSRMLSVGQIGRISHPVAWRLPDSWTFCGAEHYPRDDGDARFRNGYQRENRLDGEWGVDVNRRTWERKRRHWNRPIHLVAPSRWMLRMASESALSGGWPVTVIPNPLDVEWWGSLRREEARRRLGISGTGPVLLFGAMRSDRNFNKGADLLEAALGMVPTLHGLGAGAPLRVLIFGGRTGEYRVGPHVVRSVGPLDDEGLRDHYSAADVMVVPSRIDNLPQTAVEAIACGTPVVAFRTGGLPDIVDDWRTGRLAEPFEPASLAACIS